MLSNLGNSSYMSDSFLSVYICDILVIILKNHQTKQFILSVCLSSCSTLLKIDTCSLWIDPQVLQLNDLALEVKTLIHNTKYLEQVFGTIARDFSSSARDSPVLIPVIYTFK